MVSTKNSNKKKFLGIAAAICALSLAAVSSFALFTDTASISGATKAGNVSIGIDATDINTQLLNKDFNVNNFNPGDSRDLTYTLENTGNKAIYVRDTITLTVTPNDAYKGEDGKKTDLKDLPIKIVGIGNTNTSAQISGDSKINEDGSYTITYHPADKTNAQGELSGTGLLKEVLADHTETSLVRNYQLTFDKSAGNFYQNCDVKVDVKVNAVQHANSDGIAVDGYKPESVVTDASGVKTNPNG